MAEYEDNDEAKDPDEGAKGITDEQLCVLIESHETNAAISNINVQDQREAIQYYLGEPFGDEQEGRSQIVSREVADTIEWIKPSLMRIFASGDEVVKFDPHGPEDIEQAEQESDVLNWYTLQRNNAFTVLYSWFTDALLLRNGYVCAYWDESTDTSTEEYERLTEEEFALLQQDDEVEIVEQEESVEPELTQRPDPMTGELVTVEVPVVYYEATVKRTKKRGSLRYHCIPPERAIIDGAHQEVGLDECDFAGYWDRLSITKLRSQFPDADIPDDINDESSAMQNQAETMSARDKLINWHEARDAGHVDPSLRLVRVVYGFVRADVDGDGLAERRYVVKCGKTILYNEATDIVQMAALTPIIFPHRHVGVSMFDLLKDLQEIKSMMLRGLIDSVYLANNGRTAVNADRVVLEDLLVSRPGGIIRTNGDPGGAIMPIQHPYIGGQVVNTLEYLDSVGEKRTGVTKYSQGLDANTLNKMLDIHTPVPMADGSKKLLRDIVDGDRIIGSNGRAVSVIKAHEIHDPVRAYRMVFASGEEIIAGGEHLWTVQTQSDKVTGKTRTVDTDTLYSHRMTYAENIYVPRVQRPEFEGAVELPLDPYILGYWLGDGNGWSSRITTMDAEVVARFRRWGAEVGCELVEDKYQNSGKATTYYIKGPFYQTLRAMGLMRRDQGDDYEVVGKKIPDEYLRASYDSRLELLRGLMDSDGCHHSNALCVFSQKAGRLADDVVRLIESLGGWPSISEVNPGVLGKPGEQYQNITFSLQENPFWLPRKADKWRKSNRNVATQPIVLIEPVPIRPMRCLTVDANDGLFCVGNRFTVTHNTATGISLITQAASQRIELIARVFAETGVRSLFHIAHSLLRKHGDKQTVVKLRNKWVPINPRSWVQRYDSSVAVGLGTGDKQQQAQSLQMISMLQDKAIAQGSGLVSVDNLWNLAKQVVQTGGWKDVGSFFTDPSQRQPQQGQPPVDTKQPFAPPQQADPQAQEKQMRLQLDQMKMQQDQQRAEAELMLKKYEIDKQAEIELMQRQIDADKEVRKLEMQNHFKMLTDQITGHANQAGQYAARVATENARVPVIEAAQEALMPVVQQVGALANAAQQRNKPKSYRVARQPDGSKIISEVTDGY